MFTLSLPDGKDNKLKVTLCELFGAHIHSSTYFLIKMLAKGATFLFILRAVTSRPHRKRSTVHQKPLLIALSDMQSSQ